MANALLWAPATFLLPEVPSLTYLLKAGTQEERDSSHDADREN